MCYNFNTKLIDPRLIKLKPDKIRLIDNDGKQAGVFDFEQACQIAADKNLDLILLNAHQDPVVVRLGNYSYFKYQQEKKQRQATKKRKETKEIRISFQEAKFDMQRKAQLIKSFLEEGHQIQVKLMLKGRENLFLDMAEAKLNDFLSLIKEFTNYKIVQSPKKVGNFYYVVLSKA